MPKCNCIKCQGDLISPNCIPLENSKYDTLCEFSTGIEKAVYDLQKKPVVNLKTLSSVTGMSNDAILQLLIDQIIALKIANTNLRINSNTLCTNVDWSKLSNCTDCQTSFCTELQRLINLTNTLKIKLNV